MMERICFYFLSHFIFHRNSKSGIWIKSLALLLLPHRGLINHPKCVDWLAWARAFHRLRLARLLALNRWNNAFTSCPLMSFLHRQNFKDFVRSWSTLFTNKAKYCSLAEFSVVAKISSLAQSKTILETLYATKPSADEAISLITEKAINHVMQLKFWV